MARPPRDGRKIRPAAFARISAGRVAHAPDDHRGIGFPSRGEPSRMAADGTRLLRIDRRGFRPAALDIAEGIGAHPRGLAAFWREPGFDERGKPVAKRPRAGEL